MKNFFKVLRPGTFSTIQDFGFFNVQHLGISTSGVSDIDKYILSNKILKNNYSNPSLEFAFQGPKLLLVKGVCKFVITGNVKFNIIYSNIVVSGIPNKTYIIKPNDIIDILCTINSNYGYLSLDGGLHSKKYYNSSSTLTNSELGANNGKKLILNQKIFFYKDGKKPNYEFKTINKYSDNLIRVVRGAQMNFFFPKIIKKFFNNYFFISKNISRIGIKLEGNKIFSTKSHNINSEAVTKGAIQIPGNGNPIILMNDHPTIGGYPKIANVILSDIPKLSQMTIGNKFKFIEISIKEAEDIYINKYK